MTASATPSTACPACGVAASGKFCSNCGASLAERACPHCRAQLSPQARFCHRCGREVAGERAGSDRLAWTFAGIMCLLLVGAIIYKVASGTRGPAAPDMANPGVVTADGGATGGLAGGPAGAPTRGPDISAMGPRERFDRLFNRAMTAAEQNKADSAAFFSAMGLQAYAQLDSTDADARYHAAVLRLQLGDYPGALALADTILAAAPGHLFGYVVRGTAAEMQKDPARLARARRDFLAHYDAEVAAGRVEYREHQAVIDDFRARAGTR
jgi:Double zinc ribbon